MNPFGLLKRCYLAEDATGQKTATNQQRASAEGEQRSATGIRKLNNFGVVSSLDLGNNSLGFVIDHYNGDLVNLVNRAIGVVVNGVGHDGLGVGDGRSGGLSGGVDHDSDLVNLVDRTVGVIVLTVADNGHNLGHVLNYDLLHFFTRGGFINDHLGGLFDYFGGLGSLVLGSLRGICHRNDPELVEALVHLLLGDTELLGDLSSSVALDGSGVRVAVLHLAGRRVGYVSADLSVDRVVLVTTVVLNRRRLGESRSSRNQHHSQHSRQQHQFPQCTYLL